MKKLMSDQMVFGMDIGTRSIVGTVGMRNGDRFTVMGQCIREHRTRAMLDGQIHDIGAVAQTMKEVKEELEEELDLTLNRVCIAAAGRVLRTMEYTAELTFSQERTVTLEDIKTLDMMATQQAFDKFQKENKSKEKFYCVGYSVIRYYMDNNPIGNLENHKATSIKEDMIATFLPNDVVDGLNKAVELADLEVANMTLEPIAAIEVAIPKSFRMLNLALVDVGAGTSDICITRDGSIVAYGMIPIAGDILTETISQHCLVDFNTAEYIKIEAEKSGKAVYKDIMGLEQTITQEELSKLLAPVIDEMTDKVAAKIKELNGRKSVSAVFIVGGGGCVSGYTKALSKKLDIIDQRVAVRGEDVMGKVDFPEGTRKDSLMVTPIGICLNYYEQSNNFIMVSFNSREIKLYDNSHLIVADAAMQAEYDNRDIFPKRGRELNFRVNKKARIVRGEPGDAAVITVNGEEADINTPIHGKDVIKVKKSTAGREASMLLKQLPELSEELEFIVQGALVKLPVCVKVNGVLETENYEIREGDKIETLKYYTLGDILKFLDITPDAGMRVLVNNEEATNDTKVYSNFTVVFKKVEDLGKKEEAVREEENKDREPAPAEDEPAEEGSGDTEESQEDVLEEETEETSAEDTKPEEKKDVKDESKSAPDRMALKEIFVTVNGKPVKLTGKPEYIFVDIFNFYPFDLSSGNGREIITLVNNNRAGYMQPLQDGDVLEIRWKE